MELKYNLSYEAESNASFLVATLPEGAGFVQYQMKMLENNRIPHMLAATKYQQDDSIRICYNVTSQLSLEQATARRKIERDEFLTLLNGLVESLRDLPDYQLFAKGLLLDGQYIFVRADNFEPNFVYLPIYVEDEGLDEVRRFMRKMVVESRIADTNDNFVQRLLNLSNDQDLTVEHLEHELDDMKKAFVKATKSTVPPNMYESPGDMRPLKPPVFDPPKPSDEPTPPPLKENEPIKKPERKPEKKPTPPKSSGTSKSSLLFTILQAVIVLVLAVAFREGFFYQEGGGLNISYITGALIAAVGIDFVVYRELYVNNKDKGNTAAKKKAAKGNASTKKKEGEPRKRAEKKSAPLEAQQPSPSSPPPVKYSPAPVPFAAPAPTPVGQPAVTPSGDSADDGRTVVMDPEFSGSAYLEYYENGLAMRIHFEQGVKRIGSQAQNVDFVLNSKKVSKIHAELVRQGEHCFICDLNSTNGTFLNGNSQRIVSNQNIELHDGDRVRMADIEMVFRC